MAVSVRWLTQAESELDDIWLYISQDSPQNAAKVVVRLIEAARDLGQYPQAGHIVEEFGKEEVREYAVWPFRLVYRVTEKSVTILSIVHGAQQMPRDVSDRN